MSKVRVNYKSDLPPVAVKFKINGSVVDVPDHDFVIRFFVDGAPGTSFECAHKGDEYINCAKTATDTLTCYINNHKFGCGRLCCEFIDLSADSRYSDKVLKTVTPSCLDIVLVEGAGDENIEVLNAVFGYEINEIASITAEESDEDGGTNVVTITETNGQEFSFGVKNGHTGNGIASIETTQSAVSGGTNIVTITETNGTETEFAVLNGLNGVVLEGDPATYIADNLETDDPEKILSAKQGKRLKDEVDSISTLIGRDDVIFEKDVKYKSEYTQSTVLFESGKTYTVYVKSDIATSQTSLDIYAKKSDSTRVKIGEFESVDLSTERSFSFTASANLYSIGTPYNAGGTQPTDAFFTFKWKTGETSDVIKVVDILDKGDFEIFNVTTAKNSSSAPCWVVKQLTPIMYNGMKYKIHIQASDTYQPTAWQLWVSDYNLTTSTRENVKTFENKNLSTEQTIEYTPSQDVYAIYCGYFNGTASVDITYKVDKVDDSKRLYDDENAIKELQDGWEGAGVNEFDSYYRLGAVENDTCNLITRPIGLIVMGQSNADGRIPNSSFPATATIDTTDDLTLSKQLAHCLFMKGDPESNYGEASKNFAARNNSGLWAFDDIVYNAVNQALGGNTDFYVIKQTRGATGIRLANGSFNANVNDFVKNGYAISQLYHFKLLIERALELNPNIDFKAILWHQGEAEYQVTEEGVYYRCLCQIIYWLRGKVGNPKLPFIFGTVPTDSEQYSAVVKADMEKVAQDINDCYLVDLGAAGDMVDEYHFGATTAEKLAREMYKIMRQNSMLAPMITPIQES